jgi:3-hydroxybutyrate dehydrogenase
MCVSDTQKIGRNASNVTEMNSLPDGLSAIVTGAASGIGAACALRLADGGVHVHALDRDEAGLRELARDQDRIEVFPIDLADFDAIGALPRGIDILVNNAGIQHVAPLTEFPPDRFSHILRVMLEAPFLLIQHVLPHMYQHGYGRIVNVSSVHGLRASPFKSAYVAAKHGLEGLSKVAALEGAEHGVTSNCVNPGYVRTPLVEGQIAAQAEAHGISKSQVLEQILLAPMAVKRLIEPDEVAELVEYLCRPAAASITGASMVMDGGWTAH